MKTKNILLCSAIITLGACSSQSGARFTPRDDVAQQDYTSENHKEDIMDKKSYKQYEQREPCQHYRDLPRNMINTCVKAEDEIQIGAAQVYERKEEQPPQLGEQRLLPIVSSYTVLFDFDKSDIRANENETLDRAIREIDKFEPRQVTVTGYTDSSGKADYNQNLSREREQAVSKALRERGIENQTLEHEARGEYEQAVETADGVRNQENRRVVVDFRR
jgi:outer membrane protein OmpA-like peptidoglycan-associated protein